MGYIESPHVLPSGLGRWFKAPVISMALVRIPPLPVFLLLFYSVFIICCISSSFPLIGPAGTGKTESVKALGNQLGRFVLVFNCDETFDFQAMGRIFVGLCQVGVVSTN